MPAVFIAPAGVPPFVGSGFGPDLDRQRNPEHLQHLIACEPFKVEPREIVMQLRRTHNSPEHFSGQQPSAADRIEAKLYGQRPRAGALCDAAAAAPPFELTRSNAADVTS
jgi:hypothetical protein